VLKIGPSTATAPPGLAGMVDFDERDSRRLGGRRRFEAVELDYRAQVGVPRADRRLAGAQGHGAEPARTDLREAIEEALTPAERDRLDAYVDRSGDRAHPDPPPPWRSLLPSPPPVTA